MKSTESNMTLRSVRSQVMLAILYLATATLLIWFGYIFGRQSHSFATRRAAMSDPLQAPRILCWIMTQPDNIKSRDLHIKQTWGQRCHKLLFMSSQPDNDLPAIGLNVPEGRDNLWGKTKAAFQYIYDHHRYDADWFLKADDDTYVVMENLKFLLSSYSGQDPIYFGCKYKVIVDEGYMSGGAGYVLSREALTRLAEKGLRNSSICRYDGGGAEDAELGKCLANLQVYAGDTRDDQGRGRFFPLEPKHILQPGPIDWDFWYWKNLFHPTDSGLNCCSTSAVSFHYVTPAQMYMMEYILYHLRPVGQVSNEPARDIQRISENKAGMARLAKRA